MSKDLKAHGEMQLEEAEFKIEIKRNSNGQSKELGEKIRWSGRDAQHFGRH